MIMIIIIITKKAYTQAVVKKAKYDVGVKEESFEDFMKLMKPNPSGVILKAGMLTKVRILLLLYTFNLISSLKIP